MSGRDGVGIFSKALLDAWKNPVKIQYAPSQYGSTFQFIGKDATIVVNTQGNVVTGWARGVQGFKGN